MSNSDRTYWVSKTGLDLAEEAYRRVDTFYSELLTSVMYSRWARAYRGFYGLPGDADPWDISRAGLAGQQGELVSIKINHAGSLAKHTVALVSQTVPDFEPIATNSDYTSLTQVAFVKKLLNYFMDTEGVADKLYEVALGAAIFGNSVLAVEWDALGGPPLQSINPALPTRTKAGELTFRVFSPLDIICDRQRYDGEHDWVIVRRYVNRWDLAARYPVFADQIAGLRPKDFRNPVPPSNRIDQERNEGKADSDLIPLYTLYQRKSDAMPNGKIAMFITGDLMLYEGNLPYEQVPLIAIQPGKMLRTPYGDAPLHHVLGLQDIYDNVASAVASNNVALATQIVLIPNTAEYSWSELGEGLAALGYEPGPDGKLKPEGLNLTAPNGEAVKFLQMLKSEMETIMGINATIRGEPPPNVLSGAFGALIATQALTYAGAFQFSFQQAVAKTGDLIVSILKQYADQPIVALIAGESQGYQAQEFTRDNLSQIHRVTVKSGNPAARTPQFAMNAADALLQRGALGEGKEAARNFMTIAMGGDFDSFIEGAEAEVLNIRREGEAIRQGQNPPVLAIDRHSLHIQHHAEVIGDPASRANPQIVQAGMAHIQQHINALKTIDPALLAMRGEQTLAPPPMPGGPPGGTPPPPPGQPSHTPPPGPGGPPGHVGPAPQPPNIGRPAPLPNLPNPPINPLTGKPWSPLDGAPRT